MRITFVIGPEEAAFVLHSAGVPVTFENIEAMRQRAEEFVAEDGPKALYSIRITNEDARPSILFEDAADRLLIFSDLYGLPGTDLRLSQVCDDDLADDWHFDNDMLLGIALADAAETVAQCHAAEHDDPALLSLVYAFCERLTQPLPC